MVEVEKIIQIGKKSFDVSNISVKRKRIATRMWNNLFNIQVDEDGEAVRDKKGNIVTKEKNRKITDKKATRGLLEIGMYLIKQDFHILLRRYTPKEAVKEYVKRHMLSVRYIESLTTEEMNSFVEWIYAEMVGTKKKVVDLITPVMDQLEDLVEMLSSKELQDLQTYLMTSLTEQVGGFQKSKVSLSKS